MHFTHAIGRRFENILMRDFPGWKRMDKKMTGTRPDFFVPEGDFWVEAKTGFKDFGARVKDSQINGEAGFSRLNEPVLHAYGFHDFNDSIKRLSKKSNTQMMRILRSMNVHVAYFVSQEVNEKLWAAESRAAEKTGDVYCVIKDRFLYNIIEGTEFKRGGVVHDAESFYGIDRSKFLLVPPELGFDEGGFPYGFILDRQRDEPAIKYFAQFGFF